MKRADEFKDFKIAPRYTGEIPKILLYLARLGDGDLDQNIMKDLGLGEKQCGAGMHYLLGIGAVDWHTEFYEEGGGKAFRMRRTITDRGLEKLRSYGTVAPTTLELPSS